MSLASAERWYSLLHSIYQPVTASSTIINGAAINSSPTLWSYMIPHPTKDIRHCHPAEKFTSSVFWDTLISTPWRRLTKGLKKILVAADFKPIRLLFSLFANFLFGRPGEGMKVAQLCSSLQIRIVCECRTINPQLIVNYLSYFNRLPKCYFLLNIAAWETRNWEYAARYKWNWTWKLVREVKAWIRL